jgi:thiol-disulfide isomerase/thioredoxin
MKQKLIYAITISLLVFSCSRLPFAESSPVINTKTKDATGADMLLGHCSRGCLHESPYKEWFEKNYSDYTVDSLTADKLTPLLHDKTIVVFLGTWCGDSRREVPRLIKILDRCALPDQQLRLVMLDYQDGAYKQSPQHEEKGLQIFRVPSILVFSAKKEIGRIVESPKQSLEKDLLQIMSGNEYIPNYSAGKWYIETMEKISLDKLNHDSSSIIKKIKPNLKNSSELNSIGYVMMDRKVLDKAIFTFDINAGLYPTSITALNGKADALIRKQQKDKARFVLEKAAKIDSANAETKRLFKLIE